MLRITGFHVIASWVHLKGLELKGVPQNITTANESWCIYNTGGSNNIYELLNLHHNQGPGLFLLRGGHNLVLNCDSHDNYDPKSKSGDGSNADGFGAHIGTGDTGNVFRGCRSWWNSDDGFDFIQAQEPVTVENSWAWYNGYLSGTMTPKGNGNGFKAGGYGLPATNVPATPPSHTVQTSLAFSNRAAGFYANHHPVADHWYNNTAFHNNPDYNMLGLNGDVGILRNNIAYGGTLLSNNDGIDDANNSWNLGVTVSDADFQSVSFTGVDGPRQADGSLPDLKFMKLQAGSDLIDKGKDVGLPFVGAAPDLGAFEFGAVASSAGSGGQSGQASDAGQAGGAGLGVAGGGSAGASGASAAISGSDGGTALGLAGSAVSAAGSGATIPTMTAGTFAAGGSHATAFAGTGAAGSAAAASSSGCSCSTLHGTSSTHDAAGLSLSLFMLTACVRRRRVA